MPTFTGKSINMSIQEAYENAVEQALLTKAEVVNVPVDYVEVRRIYSQRSDAGAFRIVYVEIEAR